MGFIRLYRKFYCVSIKNGLSNYSLITPTKLSASTYVSGINGNESSTLIEGGISITEEEIGIFYVDLDPNLYAADVSYDLVFYVKYTTLAPDDKKLSRRFRIQAINIAGQLDYNLLDTTTISVEILDNTGNVIDIEILNNKIDFDLSVQEVEHYVNNNSIDINID